ncbi:MAG: sigma-70 family RNA polymerase sigma factor [Streptosporangiaceae bacterium]
MNVTAGELVARAGKGDGSAWDELVARHTGLLWSIARSSGLPRAAAEDAVQATWLRLVQRIDTLWEPESVGSWLATVCRNECHSLRGLPLPATAPEPADPSPGPEDVCVDRDRLARVVAALQAMPDRCRGVLRLLAASASYTEVSAALNVPMGSIGPTRARCLRRLRGALGE